MNRIVLNTLLIGILLIMAGCDKKSSFNHCYTMASYVHNPPFSENYSDYIKKSGFFFIKGVVLDDRSIGAHSREVKVVKDLKGNLGRKSSIPIWFNIDVSQNDTLIMLLHKCYIDNQKGHDYKTFQRGSNVLYFSNGYVSGNITDEHTTMSWDEFQKLLKSTKK